MTVDPVAWGGVITSLLGLAGGWWINRRKLKAEIEQTKGAAAKVVAEAAAVKTSTELSIMDAVGRAAAAIQDRYQELIVDMTAATNAAAARATQAENAARDAQASAAESEAQAWRAQQHARAMARFLVELRPVIAAHVPEAEAAPLLERMDRLTQLV